MRKLWRSLAYNYREGGIGQIVQKFVFRFREWFWSETAWLVYQVDLGSYTGEEKLPLAHSELDFDALCEYGYFKAQSFPEMTRARLGAGERCHGFFLGGELVNIAWTTRGRLVLDSTLSLDDEDCAGIFDCYTLPAHRSKGIYRDSLVRLLRSVQREGAITAKIAVDPGNRPSIKGIERAGFVPLFQLTRRRRFGRRQLERCEFQPMHHETESGRRRSS